MKHLLKSFLTIALSSTTALTLSNNLVTQKHNTESINSLSEDIKRYDSIDLVDKADLTKAISQTDEKIDATKDFSKTVDGVTYDYHDLLKQAFNQEALLSSTKKYDNFLSAKDKNSNGIFPTNYNGVYFPWWGFGDYFYLYLSSKTVKQVDQVMKKAPEVIIPAIESVLVYFAFSAEFIALVALILGSFPASWVLEKPTSYDDGQGVYLGITILPTPTIFEVGKQSDYISQTDTFTVTYSFLSHDYITLCTDEQGINLVANYVNKNITKERFKLFLKGLTQVDKTGWLGNILDSDYDDLIKAIDTSDKYVNKTGDYGSKIVDFAKDKEFDSANVQTRRSTPDFYEIWKNN